MSNLALGIDIGGTNTAYGLVDIMGKIHYDNSIKTSEYSTPVKLAKAIFKDISSRLVSLDHLAGVGIGAPNGNYHHGTIEFAPNLSWKGVVPLAKIFEKQFGCSAVVTNDANAAALGEMLFGAARGMKDFLLVTLGTGLGSGFVCNGQLLYGHSGMAGELGHIIVEPDGRECACGRRGCLETYASATGFRRTLALFLEKNRYADFRGRSIARTISTIKVTELAEAGHPLAKRVFDDTARYLAKGLATAVAITSPEVVFLAGGLAKSGNELTDPLEEHFNRELLQIFKDKVPLRLSALLNQNAAVLGAASLALKTL